jgi:hypothetical protein
MAAQNYPGIIEEGTSTSGTSLCTVTLGVHDILLVL